MVMDASETQQLLMHSYFILVANSNWAFCLWSWHYNAIFQLFEIRAMQKTIILFPSIHCLSKRLLTWMTPIMVSLAGGASQLLDSFQAMQSPGQEVAVMKHIQQRGLGIAWVALFLFDLLIFVLTVYRICKTRGFLRLSLVTRRNVVDIIFHDGVMYFGGNMATFTSCISVTLISRLMLNLHKSIDTGIFSTTPTQDDDDSLAVLTTRVNVQACPVNVRSRGSMRCTVGSEDQAMVFIRTTDRHHCQGNC
ncbi:hypothetical protein DFH29DRAFT_875351 [Suillus ampliporus]|nr:hypothetical protein DFH29DRAFT_875351 [Suillus ampliporus]